MTMVNRERDFPLFKMSTRILFVFLFLAGLLGAGITACDTEKKAPEPPVREYSRILRIGLIPEQDVFSQKERYTPLAAYVSEKTGIGVELEIIPQYGDIIKEFGPMSLDGAFFGSFSYALAHQRIPVEPVARPETNEGLSTYHGMLFVRKDSGIETAADMKGKSFAFVDKATTAGYLLPLKFFKDNGIKDYRKYFSETYFTGTHEDVIYDVLNRRADAGAAKNTVFNRLAQKDPRLLDELEILARSLEVPENALALRSNIDESLRTAIKDVLLEMDKDPEGQVILRNFGAARFIETVNQDYKPVFDYIKEVGLDLETFDWMTEP